MKTNLAGKICLVTGASRGIGRGIALQLGQAGATVYMTGKNLSALEKSALEVKGRGAREVFPLQIDHSHDEDVKKLFAQISDEQNGKLDLLVNNAFAAVDVISRQYKTPFWDNNPYKTWDTVNGVGLRNHFICTSLASRMMTNNKSGLIVNISSLGGLRYIFNVAYGIGKVGKDRMAADCASELSNYNVAMVSLWPGAVITEKTKERQYEKTIRKSRSIEVFESVEFPGIAITHLTADKEIMKKSGKTLLTSNLAREYGFVDIDGKTPTDIRSLNYVLSFSGYPNIARIFPKFVRIPMPLLHLASYIF